jgi:hypothetical protein
VSSTSGSAEPEIVGVARAKAEYIKAEMLAEFKRLDVDETQLTPAVVKTFQGKWEKELNELDQRVFAASLSPDSQPHVPALQELLSELRSFVETYVKALSYHYVPEGAEAPAEPAEDEKARRRAERKARMEKFKRGEKPD